MAPHSSPCRRFSEQPRRPDPAETAVDNWEIKAVVVRKINPSATEVARLDSRSGLSVRFGTPFNDRRLSRYRRRHSIFSDKHRSSLSL